MMDPLTKHIENFPVESLDVEDETYQLRIDYDPEEIQAKDDRLFDRTVVDGKTIKQETGKMFSCIVVDPPWPMKKIEREERPNQGSTLDYPTMTLNEIGNLPIKKLANSNGCHIYLWTTQKHLLSTLKILKKWGVNYQCLLTWVKPTGMTPFTWMYNTEHVLFGIILDLDLERYDIKLSFEAPTREHSRKPDVFYEIVKQVSPLPRLDMFARERREGFDAWGQEVEKFG